MTSEITLSLDLESTLADITTAFSTEYEHRNGEEPEMWTTWGLKDTNVTISEFMEITTSNWKHRPETIPPTEQFLALRVFQLAEEVDTLDIVTGRTGVDDMLRAWLDTQGIIYNDLVVVDQGTSKATLDYDIYVDDKPALADEIDRDQQLYLYAQPYNRDVARGRSNVERVESLTEVKEDLTTETVVV